MKRIGIVGTGVMGRTVAARLLEAGIPVGGFDAFPACVEAAGQAGIAMHDTLADLARESDWIVLFLPGPREIAECVAGDQGLLSALALGSIVIDMCTSSPENTETMAAAAREAGIGYLDAPVLGRPATVGRWGIPVGGDAATLDEVKPLLELLAASVAHVGPSGAGHKVKLLNQLMFGAINAMTAEMMAVAEKVGIDPGRLYEIITASQAGTVSNLFRELGGRIREARYGDPTFTVSLLVKDVRLGLEMAEAAGAPMILGRTVDFLNRAAASQGYGASDTSIMWQSVRQFWHKEGSGK
ncbi:MAG: NAD(P)-dependent oxidoreductase [Rhodocyclaceae bacterium]|nr:NAD(P)-dependent oxidoreductase [Rhodocyclaceae bacterium]